MKSFLALVICLTLSAVAVTAGGQDDKRAIENVIKLYKECGDNQDASIADRVFHDDFLLFYHGPDGVTKTNKIAYKSLISGKKIGGDKRSLTLSDLRVYEDIGSATAIFNGAHADFTQYITLMKIEDEWKIMNIVLKFEAKKS